MRDLKKKPLSQDNKFFKGISTTSPFPLLPLGFRLFDLRSPSQRFDGNLIALVIVCFYLQLETAVLQYSITDGKKNRTAG